MAMFTGNRYRPTMLLGYGGLDLGRQRWMVGTHTRIIPRFPLGSTMSYQETMERTRSSLTGRMMPRSVMMAAISSAGVTSKAGL
jgi:hypothetical protein